MKVVDTISRSGRNLKSAKLRTFLTALAIAIGGFTLVLTLAASQGARDYTNRLVSTNFDPRSVVVAKDKDFFGSPGSSKPKEYSEDLANSFGIQIKQLESKDIAKIESLPHVKQVIANYDLNAQFITRDGSKKYVGALSVYDAAQKPQIAAGEAPAALSDNSVLMSDEYLSLLHFSSARDAIGKTVTVQVRQLTGQTSAKDYKVVGVTTKSSLDLGFTAVGLRVSENEASRINEFVNGGTVLADKVPSVLVRGDGVPAETLKQEIQNAGYQAKTAQDLQEFLTQIVNVLGIIIAVFGAITLVASFFGVVNTQYISVLERTREIGLMKALGMSRGTVSRLFIIEATLIGFIGAVLGAGVGIATGTLLNPWISQKIKFGHEHLLVFKPGQVIALVVFLMIVTTVAGLLPARKAAKLDPIEALRTE
jgi:putative ABC transport system permease protein